MFPSFHVIQFKTRFFYTKACGCSCGSLESFLLGSICFKSTKVLIRLVSSIRSNVDRWCIVFGIVFGEVAQLLDAAD